MADWRVMHWVHMMIITRLMEADSEMMTMVSAQVLISAARMAVLMAVDSILISDNNKLT